MKRKAQPTGATARSFEPRCRADHERLALIESDRPDDDIWLDVRAVEMYLRKPRRVIYKLVESGRLPCQRMGRAIIVRKSDASRFLD